jgi:polysaccharide pyruvyl transferase WcaK-like protein
LQIAPEGMQNVSIHNVGKLALLLSLVARRMLGLKTFYCLIPGGINGEKSAAASLSGFLYNLSLIFVKLIGVTSFQLGVSYDSLGSKHTALLRSRSRSLTFHFVRDHDSLAYCNQRKIHTTGVAPDLAFLLDPVQTQKGGRDVIGFSFRFDRTGEGEVALSRLEHAICLRFPNRDVHFALITQVHRDSLWMNELLNRLLSQGYTNCSVLDASTSISGAIECYRKCGSVYSNRLHVLLLSLSTGCQPFPVVNKDLDRKVIGVFDSLMPGLCIQHDDLGLSMHRDLDDETANLIFERYKERRIELIDAFERIFSE